MKKVVKVLALLMAVVFAVGMLAACGGDKGKKESSKSDIKVGLICLHDDQSTYDKNFIDAFKAACEAEGVEYEIRTNIPEGQECYDAAVDLADRGCNFIFADSFGHEDYVIQAAKEFPDVKFSHATGTKAHTEKLDNYSNAFADIYMGRYLAGVAAGMKINEMIESGKITADQAKMGYVGAFTYAEVMSGYTSFYLGAKSVCPTVTMDVTFTGSWYDPTLEQTGAENLIKGGCVLISQHADSHGAPIACENAGVPDVSYNGSTIKDGPNTFIVSSRINWEPYFRYAIQCTKEGKVIDKDFSGTVEQESVLLTEVNEAVAAKGTAEKIEEVKAELVAGTRHVFDCSTFTVEGKPVTSYLADVDDMGDYVGETEVIIDGYFHESEFRSAPYFDLQIDGITLLDTNVG